ncbi:UTRA domain-containing protein [Rhodophyticola sp. CCM32]|uniref:UTRA domain-containing protein n=1 Tax=Rhodophyticola sp. CCM32 TaxID=2916397 RepID=UPI001EE5B1F8|nr:UTRA domain-containing protein [Rhodophyticola sp. CCM32]
MTTTFRDIKADVLDRIANGDWGPGVALPSEMELAKTYGCARATVNRALRELAEEGLLDRKRKSGTRVRMTPTRRARFDIPITRREVENRGEIYRYALVWNEEKTAPGWLAARMGLNTGTPVQHIICMHYADGNPFQYEDRWINLLALPQVRDTNFSTVSPNEWLVATIPFSDAEIGFSSVSADENLSRHLGCAEQDALFQMDRSTWFEGKPVTFVKLYFQRGYRMATKY